MQQKFPPLSQDAKDAADILLAMVGIPAGMMAQDDVSMRMGAAMAAIADASNTRLKNLQIEEEDKARAYYKGVGGAFALTVKFATVEARPAVAAVLFFYMAEFLTFGTHMDADAFVNEFMDSMLKIARTAREEGFV